MKIKMTDVARYLGISKATVSLAVNGKQGVNEQTRQKILTCIEEMEKNGGTIPQTETSNPNRLFQIIKVVIMNHRKQVVCDPELDLWSEVLNTFDTEARKRGYLYGLTYLNDTEENLRQIIDECNLDIVAGVILFGTEMEPSDYPILHKIQKPLIIYDYEMPDGCYSSVCIDNAQAVEIAVEFLRKNGASKICYFSTGKVIYNFMKRREAFQNSMLKTQGIVKKENMVSLGNTIEEITVQATAYLNTHKLPDALLFENYQISIGTLNAIRRLGIRVPEDVKIIGIDEIPPYIVPDIKLPQIRIPHAERATMAINLLDREITDFGNTKVKVFAIPELKNPFPPSGKLIS